MKLITKMTWLGLFLITSCMNEKTKIKTLMKSDNVEERVLGAYMAGNLQEKEFIPYLLKDSFDPATSTSFKFKGISVYQQKMFSLKKILKISPPVEITWKPDSVIIKFYSKAYNDLLLKNKLNNKNR